MGNWQEGVYNSDYILHQRGLVAQLKFESTANPARLDEISAERFEDGEAVVVFTTHPDATNDSKQGGMYARLAYNTLFQELRNLSSKTALELFTSNEEVHYLKVKKGRERLLLEGILLLEQYDNSLAEVSNKIRLFLSPKGARVDELEEALDLQTERLKLLKGVLNREKNTKKVLTRSTKPRRKSVANKKKSAVAKKRSVRRSA